MKPSEILRSLADMIDAKQSALTQSGPLAARIQPAPSKEAPEIGAGDGSGLAQQPDDIFIPPLQLKLELLKKATGVENVYDDEEAEQAEANSYEDLQAIKRNAGISVTAISELGDDEPLEG